MECKKKNLSGVGLGRDGRGAEAVSRERWREFVNMYIHSHGRWQRPAEEDIMV